MLANSAAFELATIIHQIRQAISIFQWQRGNWEIRQNPKLNFISANCQSKSINLGYGLAIV